MKIHGKNALVTGASAGIGRAVSLMLARHGAAKVVLADIDRSKLDAVAADIRALGGEAIIEHVDLSDPAATTAMYQRAEQRTDGLDIIHNNAGIMGGPPDFPDADLQRMIAAVQINLVAMMIGTTLGVDFMRKRGASGVIINTSSVAAFSHLPKDPAYTASKHGILAFSQSCKPLKDEFGIRVVPICPAVTDTAIVAKDAPWLKPVLEKIKLLTPDDVADAVRDIIENDELAGDPVVLNNEQIANSPL